MSWATFIVAETIDDIHLAPREGRVINTHTAWLKSVIAYRKAGTREAPPRFEFIFMKKVLHDRSCQWIST